MLSKNVKVEVEQSLALVYVIYLYKSYWLHISD